jgi:methylenetetrahydrofolate--tRNA-(uracil-5-)-methyltransferase
VSAPLVQVVGGGLAGCEAAWQAAQNGARVRLYEMRPRRNTPAHKTDGLAELVCSNSFKSLEHATAHGLLKEEIKRCGSMLLECALEARVPAGGALAVDRLVFSEKVEQRLASLPNLEIVREEVERIPEDSTTVLAVGPLVSESLAASIAKFVGQDYLYFYDAIAPVIEAGSIDRSIVFQASRYDKGDTADYLNCPFNEEEYTNFINAVLAGEMAPLHDVDNTPFFEACLPIEEMARRGPQTLSFGPIFRSIPGLQDAAFVRLGQIHRNCYINAPTLLDPTLATRTRSDLFFAGQISGVEGYTESIASGLLAGRNAALVATGCTPEVLPEDTMLGALCHYIAHADPENYQPTNVAFGLLPPAPRGVRKKRDRKLARAARALKSLDDWLASRPELV